jgi:hypothetical protein
MPLRLVAVIPQFTILGLATLALAGESAGAVAAQKVPISPESVWIVGFIFGYFLTFSIRHGSKTQDVFKGFLGLSGAIGGTAGLVFAFKDSENAAAALVSYGWGTAYGFATYLTIAFILAIIYSGEFTYKKDEPATGAALFAEILGKVLLGEDLRPPLSK